MMLLAKIKVALSVTVALALLAGGFGVATLPASWAENDEAKPAANPQPVRNQPGPKLNEPEFLRRVSLDLRGIVPTELEMRYFLADVDAKKRTRVVEWMLKDVNEGRHQAMFTPQAHDVVNWVGPMNDALWVTDADVKNSSYAEVFQNLASSTEAASLFLGRTNVLNEVLISHDDRPVLVTVPEPYRTLKFNTSSYELLNAATKAQLRYSAYRYVKAVDTSDEGFLHRAIQDARGVAPSTIELEYFKADKDPKKREKLLDLLLKDPAVAKKVGADWKANMLQPAHGYYTLTATPTTRLYYSLARNKLHAPNRLDTLIGQLLDGKRTDEQVLEGLSLALLGRLPTESERKLVLAQVGKQQDKPAAWREVLTTLAATGEAKKHADAVKQQGTAK